MGPDSIYLTPAEETSRRLSAHDPENAQGNAYFRLGLYLHEQGHREAAIAQFKRAHELKPDNWNYKRQAWALADLERGLRDDETRGVRGRHPALPAARSAGSAARGAVTLARRGRFRGHDERIVCGRARRSRRQISACKSWVDGRAGNSGTEVPLDEVLVARKGHGGKADAEPVPPRFKYVFRLRLEGPGNWLRR